MKRLLVLGLIAVLLIGSTIALAMYPARVTLPTFAETDFFPEGSPLMVAFSQTGHFFDNNVSVVILASNPDAEIHYTLDGGFPTIGSAIYTSPITLTARRTTDVTVLRAKAVYGDEVSEILTHTFFVGQDVNQRFTTLVFSISADRADLYDFYTGILIEGVTRRDFRQENPGAHISPTSPANFNWRGREDSERPAHVEAFYADGTRILTQLCGLRVFGSWSRAETVKSLRLTARRDYSPEAGRFHYPFFPDAFMVDEFGDTPIRAYNELILRNGGNDRNHGMIRHELGSTLARRAGFIDVSPVRAATLFINGNFYGHMWLQTRCFEHFLQEVYGTPTRDFDVIGRGEWWFRNATEEQEEALTYKNNFAWRDLNDPAEWARFNEIVDVDNLLWYYALQIFLGNGDWPHNNLRRWRYTGPAFEGMAPQLDGRWRYIIFDLDQTFGLFGRDYDRPNFHEVLVWDNYAGQLIRNILTRQDMAERFTMIMNDIVANVVNYNTVSEVMGQLWRDIAPEVHRTIETGNLLAHWTGFNSIGRYHDSTLRFARRRHLYINDSLSQKFGFPQEFFDVDIIGGEAIIGTVRATQSSYFAHLTVPVVPVLPNFTAFDHWLVNGVRVDTERIYVTAADAVNGAAQLELVTREDFPLLLIEYAYVDGIANGLTLYNPNTFPVRTSGLFLSRWRDDLTRFPLPAATLEPGGTLELVGNSSASHEDHMRVQMNFNVREGRRLFLSDINGTIVHSFIF